MSGHSKWSQIKRQKGANDAKRGAVFTKIAREIGIAARAGGPDPDANYRLRLAIDKARSVNMPADNIKRAIERRRGGDKAEEFEEIVYEGYGPGGVAHPRRDGHGQPQPHRRGRALDLHQVGRQLAGAGAVAWQFEPRGVISVVRERQGPRRDRAAGHRRRRASDVDTEADPLEITTDPGRPGDRAPRPRGRGLSRSSRRS